MALDFKTKSKYQEYFSKAHDMVRKAIAAKMDAGVDQIKEVSMWLKILLVMSAAKSLVMLFRFLTGTI